MEAQIGFGLSGFSLFLVADGCGSLPMFGFGGLGGFGFGTFLCFLGLELVYRLPGCVVMSVVCCCVGLCLICKLVVVLCLNVFGCMVYG